MKRTIEITEQEIKDLKLIRNYFGEHDKTPLEHLAYSELDKLVKKLQQADVSGSLPIFKCKCGYETSNSVAWCVHADCCNGNDS